MKGIYNYYVTYAENDFSFNPFGAYDLSRMIKGINISFRLLNTYRIIENKDGGFDIDVSFIKNEVCEKLWDIKYEPELKKQGLTKEQIREQKQKTINFLLKEITIIAWSETRIR